MWKSVGFIGLCVVVIGGGIGLCFAERGLTNQVRESVDRAKEKLAALKAEVAAEA